MQHPTLTGTVTVAGKPSMDLDPKTERSILRQAHLYGNDDDEDEKDEDEDE